MIIPDPILVFPEFLLPTAAEFYHNFDPAKIPFFEDFEIMAVDKYDADGNRNYCYAGAASLTSMLPVVLAATLVNLLA